MSRIRNVAAVVSASALLGGGGLGAAQAATSSSSGSARPPAGHRGGGPVSTAQLAAIAKQLGVSSARLKAAIDANRPARPDHGPRGDDMASALATALGVDTDKVQAILDANRPARPAGPPSAAAPAGDARPDGDGDGRPVMRDDAKLVAALASGLGIDSAAVQAAFATIDAAHKAEHDAGDSARYAAIAKQLGLSSASVKAAFEAHRPARHG